jgi:hypothetical protein
MYKVELKQSSELANIQRAHLQNSEHEYQKQIQKFEHHMSLNLVAPKQQEYFQMELRQQQKRHEDAQYRALRAQLRLREVVECEEQRQLHYAEHLTKAGGEAKQLRSAYEKALAEQQMTRTAEMNLKGAEGQNSC